MCKPRGEPHQHPGWPAPCLGREFPALWEGIFLCLSHLVRDALLRQLALAGTALRVLLAQGHVIDRKSRTSQLVALLESTGEPGSAAWVLPLRPSAFVWGQHWFALWLAVDGGKAPALCPQVRRAVRLPSCPVRVSLVPTSASSGVAGPTAPVYRQAL